jgi:hypothetical protein
LKKIAILQSNYIPWKGYFDIINMVDEFVIFDSVQYTKNDWRNRNKIKTQQGVQWLTIPVEHKNLYQTISETKISNSNWNKKHWSSIIQNYSKTKYFKEYKDVFEKLYLSNKNNFLSEINYNFIITINSILKISTTIKKSTEFILPDEKTEKLVKICKDCNAKVYLSGSAAKDYLNTSLFDSENIQIKWMDYSGYKEYSQLYPPFEHNVSVLDLLFNEGPNAKNFMKSFEI